MRIAVTGPDGFLAFHLRCLIRSRWGGDAIHIGREHFADPERMAKALVEADAVVHLAGVNRASDDEIARVNPWLAERLVAGLERLERPMPVVYGNSVHADGDSLFGIAKRRAAEILQAHGRRSGSPVVDVVLPNVFGEWGRPFYNSVVATFSHQLARGDVPRVDVDRPLPLLHAQAAAACLLQATESPTAGRVDPPGRTTTVTEVLTLLRRISEDYRHGELPELSDAFTRDLFNTYRSFTVPQQWPIHPPAKSDGRGTLHEAVRAGGGESQVFFSTTRPAATRGQHFHLHKVERFLVLRGSARIRMRRLFRDEVWDFDVSGHRPAIVDMPTMAPHSITNTGTDDLLTLFFADAVFDPENGDTYAEDV